MNAAPTQPTRNRALLAMALGGLGVAASVATIYAAPVQGVTSLSCGIKALDCSTALTSQFSKLAGVPLGVLGACYFMLWLLVFRAYWRTGAPLYQALVSYVTLLGAVVSLSLGFVMFVILKAPCLYCLLTHISNLGSFVLLWPYLSWRFPARATADERWHLTALVAVALLAATATHFAEEARIARIQLATWIASLQNVKSAPESEQAKAAEEEKVPEWSPLSELAVAKQLAASEGRLLFVEFMDPRCGHCLQFRKSVLETAVFARFATRDAVVAIFGVYDLQSLAPEESSALQLLVDEHQITETPTILIFTPDGSTLLHRLSGYDGTPAEVLVTKWKQRTAS